MSIFNNDYDKLETKVSLILTNHPDTILTHRFLCNEISSTLEIKDPVVLNKLKDDIAIVMRFLKKYKNFDVFEENGMLKAVFILNTADIKPFTEIVDEQPNKSDDKNISTDISVIEFIVDNDLHDYVTQVDFKGNLPLHYLMIKGDLMRIKKVLDTYDIDENQLLIENNNGETPVDLVKDIRVTNFLIKRLINDKNQLKKKVSNLTNNCISLNTQMSSLRSCFEKLSFNIQLVVIFYSIYLIVIYFQFNM
jgi:hypothetical protein